MISKDKKTLPVTYPPLTTYPAFAATLSILSSYEEAFDWMYSHYIQIYAADKVNRGGYKVDSGNAPYKPLFFGDSDNRRLAYTNADFIFFAKDVCQYFDLFAVPSDMFISGGETFVSMVKRSIGLDMYLYIYADQSKIGIFNRSNGFVHPLFIYGYDDEEGTVSAADFVDGKFVYFKCSYDEIEAAYRSGIDLPNYCNNLPKESESIALIRYTNYAPFVFDFSYVQDSVREYLYPDKTKADRFTSYIMSRFSFSDQILKIHMGIDVYQYLSDLVELEFGAGKDYLDYRIYHAMCDHKAMMIKRVEHFIKQGYLNGSKASILEEYMQVQAKTLSARNCVLKYNMQNDKETAYKIPRLMAEAKDLEIPLLIELFDL